ncbi:AraC family transcriptional regulator [Actinomycetes bacterium KLBMP 9797]
MTHDVVAGAPLRLQLTSPPTYWRCEPSWSWHSRPLPDHLLWCVLDGVGRLSVRGHEFELGPGACAVFAPGDEPVASHDPRRRLLVFGMHFKAGEPSRESEPSREGGPSRVVWPERGCFVRDQALLAALARRCEASHRRGDPLGRRQSLLCLEQLLLLLWEEWIHPAPGPVDAALDELTHAIRQDPSRRWTVAELAGRAGLSRAQFTRRFTAHTGLSPARFLIQARIDRAAQLLTETNMSVTQVASTLGYTDIAYFSRQFTRQTGHSPRHARALAEGVPRLRAGRPDHG